MSEIQQLKADASFILSEAAGHRSRDNIIIASGAGKVPPGTVLGRVTVGGKYKPSIAAAADGSQLGAAINIYGVDATTADVAVAAIVRDAEVNKHELGYDGTVDDDAKKTAMNVSLVAAGIIPR